MAAPFARINEVVLTPALLDRLRLPVIAAPLFIISLAERGGP